jgi:hypothetical protein
MTALAKRADVDGLRRDADYFATELARRLDRLAQLQPRKPWAQAAVLTRRLRQLPRNEIRHEQRRANRLQRG